MRRREDKVVRGELLKYAKSAYNINLPICRWNPTRLFLKHPNCPLNPNCHVGLSEAGKGHQKRTAEEDTFDPKLKLRSLEVEHIGLVNIGQTCYMNTIIQLLYHNLPCKAKIYQVDVAIEDIHDPTNPIVSLQALFGELQLSGLHVVHTDLFIQSLGLDKEVQQDVHEMLFWLLHRIDECMPSIHLLELFTGQLKYATCCDHCHRVDSKEENYVEIIVNTSTATTLEDSILAVLEDVPVQDYRCKACQQTSFTQSVKYLSLPDSLVFVIPRFDYDIEQQRKVKVFREVQIPFILHMDDLLEKDASEKDHHSYYLSTVVCHRGRKADGGHYVSYQYDNSLHKWFLFNDAKVTPYTPSNFGFFRGIDTSAEYYETPYLVLYRPYEAVHIPDLLLPPLHVKEAVDMQTRMFHADLASYEEKLQIDRDGVQARRKYVDDIFRNMTPSERPLDMSFISTKWLKSWASQGAPGPIDNRPLLCPHGKLAIRPQLYKRISHKAWKALQFTYGGGPSLSALHLCYDCLIARKSQEAVRQLQSKIHAPRPQH